MFCVVLTLDQDQGKIWIRSVPCTGSESTLKSCAAEGRVLDMTVGPDGDAGLICS
ncbi:hypothetical protein M9458_051499, partial [Cirrhinus mrigala]